MLWDNNVRHWWVAGLLLILLSCPGCHSWPGSFAAGVDDVTVWEKVRDARAQRIESLAGLRVDSAARSQFDAAMVSDELDVAREYALSFFEQAHALAVETAASEIRRLDDEAINDLGAQYFTEQVTSRDQLIAAYQREADAALADQQRAVNEAESVAQLRLILELIDDRVEQPVKYQGKTGRMLTWFPFYLPSKIAADRVQESGPGCPLFLGGFDAADIYTAQGDVESTLERYAPTLVVEQNAEATYAPQADDIGRVVADDVDHVSIDTDEPVIYGYSRWILLAGHEHEQLIYTAWFPEHPQLEPDDPMAGHIDGLTVRITLDRSGRPAIVETIANCGCFHGLYPTRELEDAVQQEFGPPEEGTRYTLERDAGHKLNAHIPSLLELTDLDARPVVYVAAGWHSIVHVTFEPPDSEDATEKAYWLSPYTDLELLPTPDGGYTSMFYDNGLVRHAQRPEGVYFTPLGMLSAGQPRQRETQLIYWDQYDFDEPGLLSRLLHLPSNF